MYTTFQNTPSSVEIPDLPRHSAGPWSPALQPQVRSWKDDQSVSPTSVQGAQPAGPPEQEGRAIPQHERVISHNAVT